jgi:hypothetical protein
MADNNLNAADLAGVQYGGLVREDVMEKIWDISSIPLPFTDLCSKATHSNRKVEFTTDKLRDPVTDNAAVDGADIDQDDTNTGQRLGNYTQISTKEVKISHSAEASNSVGGAGKLAYQITMRQRELRRDVEAQMLTHQASVAGDGDTIAGISAGLGAQLKTNVSVGATGSVGGFNFTTGLFVAPTAGTARALSETTIRDVLQDVYEAGGSTELLMARPPVIRKLSEYLFSGTARVATLQSNKEQKGDGGALTAYGSVNVFVTDFGQTIQLRDNRLQPADASGVSSVYLLDPAHLEQSFLRGYQVEPLAKTGLSEKRLMSCEYSLKVLNESSQGAILDIDETAAVVA